MTPEHIPRPDWLDTVKLDAYLPQMIDGYPAEARTAMIAAFERGDAELVFHEDELGHWVGVRVLGVRVGRVHRSRVQRVGAN